MAALLGSPAAASVAITEFMASNSATLADGDGVFSDWIEIHNSGDTAVDLAGWHLTDAADEPMKWTFPAGGASVLEPDEYRIVFASGRGASDPVDDQGFLHTSFRLSVDGEYLALLPPGGVPPATEFSPAFPAQRQDVSYATADGLSWGFYDSPTPGAANEVPPALPDAVAVAPPGGVFFGSIQVALSAPEATPGAVIRYTLDGSAVSEASSAYSGPLTLTARTLLRARAFRSGAAPGPESSSVFVRAESDAAGFSSNLPIIVVDTDGSIPPTTSTSLVGAHALVFEPDPVTGRSVLSAVPDAATRSGLRVRGRSSAGFPKRQYKFETWDADGAETNVSLLGLGGESNWVLHGPYTDKSLMRNALAYSIWGKMGWSTVDTRFVEVFLNDDRNPRISYADDYVGVYILVEAITIDDDRVDIEKPEPSSNASEITGGYIVESGNADSQQFTTTGSRRTVAHRFADPNQEDLNSTQRQWIRNYIQRFEEALYAQDFRHPVGGEHYSELTDSASQVDYKIMREWTRNFDGGSTFSYIDRGGKLVMSPVWDFNWALGNVNYAEGGDLPGYRTDGWNRSFTAPVNGWAPWWLRFEQDPDWWQAFIDRWTDLRESTLSDEAISAEIEEMTTLLEAEAAGRNFARWPVLGTFTSISPPGWQARTTFRSEVDYLKDWLRDRSAWIDAQFPARPVFSPAGGAPPPGTDPRILSADERGVIHYTTDGSDPRLPGGDISPAAATITAAGGIVQDFLVGIDTTVAALRPTSDSPGLTAWTLPGFDDSSWVGGPNGVGYENSPGDYADLIVTPVGFFPGLQPTSVYVRIPFSVEDPDAYTKLELRVKRDDGFVAYLNGQEIARRNAPSPLAWNSAATAAHPPDETNFPFETIDLAAVLAAAPGEGLLAGENLLAFHVLNVGVANAGNTGSPDSDMLLLPLLVGERISQDAGTLDLSASAIVTARARDGSTWGPPARTAFVIGQAPADAGNVVVSEIHFHPAEPTPDELAARPSLTGQDLEWIELRNISDAPVDLTGARFTEGIRYDFSPATVLAPGGFLVIASNPAAFAVRHPGLPSPLGPFDGALDNAGESIALTAVDDSPIAAFAYRDDWHPETDGGGFSLNLADESVTPADYSAASAWIASSVLHGTPGGPNIPDTTLTYATWLASHFTGPEIAAGILTDPEFDAEPDGLPNLVEFALGLDPRSPDADPISIVLDAPPGGPPTAALVFIRPKDRTGIGFTLEASPDLAAWTTDTEAVWTTEDLGNGTERVTVISSHSPPMPSGAFLLRLRISSPVAESR